VEYYRNFFKLSKLRKDGVTEYDHWIQAYKQTGIFFEELNFGQYLKELNYLVEWFYELAGTRLLSESGPMPITFRDIMAWKDLLSIDIHPWEVKAIRSLDDAYLTTVMEWQREK